MKWKIKLSYPSINGNIAVSWADCRDKSSAMKVFRDRVNNLESFAEITVYCDGKEYVHGTGKCYSKVVPF